MLTCSQISSKSGCTEVRLGSLIVSMAGWKELGGSQNNYTDGFNKLDMEPTQEHGMEYNQFTLKYPINDFECEFFAHI